MQQIITIKTGTSKRFLDLVLVNSDFPRLATDYGGIWRSVWTDICCIWTEKTGFRTRFHTWFRNPFRDHTKWSSLISVLWISCFSIFRNWISYPWIFLAIHYFLCYLILSRERRIIQPWRTIYTIHTQSLARSVDETCLHQNVKQGWKSVLHVLSRDIGLSWHYSTRSLMNWRNNIWISRSWIISCKWISRSRISRNWTPR